MDGHATTEVFAEVFLDVLLVLPRHDDDRNTVSPSCEHLFLDAAHRKDVPRQCDLAGHGHVAANRTPSQLRHEGDDHRHPGRRAVLGNSARRHVQVDLGVSIEPGVDAETADARPEPGERGPRRLFHDVAQMSGQGQRPGALHPPRLHEQHIAARGRPSQADRYAGLLRPFRHFFHEEARSAEHLHDGVRCDIHRGFESFGAPPRDLSTHRADLALEVSDTRLPCIATDDRPESGFGEADLLGLQPVVGHLFRH